MNFDEFLNVDLMEGLENDQEIAEFLDLEQKPAKKETPAPPERKLSESVLYDPGNLYQISTSEWEPRYLLVTKTSAKLSHHPRRNLFACLRDSQIQFYAFSPVGTARERAVSPLLKQLRIFSKSLDDEQLVRAYSNLPFINERVLDISWHLDGFHLAVWTEGGKLMIWECADMIRNRWDCISTFEKQGGDVKAFLWTKKPREFLAQPEGCPKLSEGISGLCSLGPLSFACLTSSGLVSYCIYMANAEGEFNFFTVDKQLDLPEGQNIHLAEFSHTNTSYVTLAVHLDGADHVRIFQIAASLQRREINIEEHLPLPLRPLNAPEADLKLLILKPLPECALMTVYLYQESVYFVLWTQRQSQFFVKAQKCFTALPTDVRLVRSENFFIVSLLDGRIEFRDASTLNILHEEPLCSNGSVYALCLCESVNESGFIGLLSGKETTAELIDFYDNASTESLTTMAFWPFESLAWLKERWFSRLCNLLLASLLNRSDTVDLEWSLKVGIVKHAAETRRPLIQFTPALAETIFRCIYCKTLSLKSESRQPKRVMHAITDKIRAQASFLYTQASGGDFSSLARDIICLQVRILRIFPWLQRELSCHSYASILQLLNARELFLNAFEDSKFADEFLAKIAVNPAFEMTVEFMKQCSLKQEALFCLTSVAVRFMDVLAYWLKEFFFYLSDISMNSNKSMAFAPILHPVTRMIIRQLLVLTKTLKLYFNFKSSKIAKTSQQAVSMDRYLEIAVSRTRIRVDSTLEFLDNLDVIQNQEDDLLKGLADANVISYGRQIFLLAMMRLPTSDELGQWLNELGFSYSKIPQDTFIQTIKPVFLNYYLGFSRKLHPHIQLPEDKASMQGIFSVPGVGALGLWNNLEDELKAFYGETGQTFDALTHLQVKAKRSEWRVQCTRCSGISVLNIQDAQEEYPPHLDWPGCYCGGEWMIQ